MKSKYRFTSFLAAPLAAYLPFKRALGYTNFGSETCLSVAKSFDHYLTFRDCSSPRDLTENLIANWIYAIPSHSALTRNKYLTFARSFLDYLQRRGIIKENHARRIPYLKFHPRHPYLFTLQEIQALLQAARAFKNPSPLLAGTLECLFFLLYASGIRLGEAFRLRICDVDFQDRTLSLWHTKFHKERLVPLSLPTANKLAAYLARRLELYPTQDARQRFFVHRGKALYYILVHLAFHQCLDKAQIPHRVPGGARIHDLRHTFAVHRLYKWYQEGFDLLNKLPILSTYMGHTHIAHTQVYLTISQALLREGDRRFQGAFEDLARRNAPRSLRRR